MTAFTIGKKIRHHASHSGYDQLAKYVGTPLNIPNWIYQVRGLGFLHRYFRKKSGMAWYDGLYGEIFTAWHMRTHPEAIYHFLYAESSFRFVPHLAPVAKHRIVCTFHAAPEQFPQIMKSTAHLEKIGAAIVVSNVQRPRLESILGKERVFFIPHGVDCEYFMPPNSEKTDSRKICLCVGHHHRDYATLCKVAAIIKDFDPEIRFIVINQVFSVYFTCEEQQFYRKSFAAVGNIELREAVTDQELLQLYQSSDLMVLPLLDATANIALLEALSCGLPVIVTDLAAVRDYVDSNNVALAPPQNAEIMAEHVIRLLQDPVERQQLSEGARKRGLSLDWRKIAEKVKQLYDQIT